MWGGGGVCVIASPHLSRKKKKKKKKQRGGTEHNKGEGELPGVGQSILRVREVRGRTTMCVTTGYSIG